MEPASEIQPETYLSPSVQSPNLSHPFHLHGYTFAVVGIGRSPDQNVKKINLKHTLDLDRRGLLHRHFNLPPLKDTIAVPNNGYVIFRFRADNPGWSRTFAMRVSQACYVFRLVVVPLPLPVPHSDRDEPDSTRGDAEGPPAGSARFPEVRQPPAANNVSRAALVRAFPDADFRAIIPIHTVFFLGRSRRSLFISINVR